MQSSWGCDVPTSQPVTFNELTRRIEQGHRKALVRTFVLSFMTVAIAAVFLVFILRELERANQQLETVNNQISVANAAVEKAQTELKTAQDALQAAVGRATTLQDQVVALEAQLATSKKALAEALDLGKYVYKLDWRELKMMYVENGPAVEVLDVIQHLKDQVHWGMSNTQAGGYNSPGFAKLILQKLRRLPADADLASLPSQDPGPPNAGDVVVYESGYYLFYFRDHEKREFVVGMTPFGVASLNYDFGVKRTAILRTGFPPK